MKKRHQEKRSSSRRGRNQPKQTPKAAEEIVDWLRDAYAMERGVEAALEKHAHNDDLSPVVRKKAAAHLKETRRHAEDIRSVLKSLGAATSLVKTSVGTLAQTAKGMGTIFARDERIKDLLDSYSMEHFEIVCYTALAVAAEHAGLTSVVETCNRIIPDEQRMAETLLQLLPEEVEAYLFEAQRTGTD